MKRAIEDSFPIVEINRLAVPERNAFKPIYQMHKWFARRASCVFRAILLGALKPLPVDKDGKPTKSGAEVIMDEFYRDHTDDRDTNGKHILDPFMGGGTTVVEALRLGCRVTGIDLNPVAWFIVKTEVEPVDLDELREAFDGLAKRKVEWSGKPLKETLLDLYKTTCPSCGGEADTIYTFWVKGAPCTAATCKRQTPLFSDYIVSRKTPSIRYMEDCECPECRKVFDWEIEPACMIGDEKLMVNATRHSAGHGRSNARWAYGYGEQVKHEGWRGSAPCPWCGKNVLPFKPNAKPKRKKVELSILLCPKCEEVWQLRGPLADEVQCPSCKHAYDPHNGPVPGSGKFNCACGNQAKIIDAIRSLPEDRLLPMHAYGMECFCPACAKKPSLAAPCAPLADQDLFGKTPDAAHSDATGDLAGVHWKNSGKFYKRMDSADLARYQRAEQTWEANRSRLPHPKAAVPSGEKTKSGLLAHHYSHWHRMFNARQLLALATILSCIEEERGRTRDQLVLCLSATTDTNNLFTRFMAKRESAGGQTAQGVFARHDFQPKNTVCEQNVWGLEEGGIGSFVRRFWQTEAGIEYALKTSDVVYSWDSGKRVREVSYEDNLYKTGDNPCVLYCRSSKDLSTVPDGSADLVVTDPPYSDNVNYSELGDFYYVWQRLALVAEYPHCAPEITPKADEVIKNRTRGKDDADFAADLTAVFMEANKKLRQDGLLIFTFHHAAGEAWASLLASVCDAGFEILAVYPIQSEGESSLHLMDKEAISYDLIHVCAKRPCENGTKARSWAGVRQEIRRRARLEIEAIEGGRYGNEPLPVPDRNIILIGKCLEFYSAHYGRILDHEGEPLPLQAALEEIRMMVDQLTSEGNALPSELESVDAPSYVYLTCLCDHKEIKSDDVNKVTKGIFEEPSALMKHGLMTKGRAKRGRTYEVKQPLERLEVLRKKFGVGETKAQQELFDEELNAAFVPGEVFIDRVHLLLALVESGENVIDWLDRFRGQRPAIRAALEYMARKNRGFADPVRKILGLMDEKTLFNREEDINA